MVTVHSWVHDVSLHPYKSLPQALYHRWWIRSNEEKNIKQADAVICVSKYVQSNVKALTGIDGIVIYNGVDTNRFVPSPGHHRDRNSDKDKLQLLYLGAMRHLKGIDLLPAIAENVQDIAEIRYTGTREQLLIGGGSIPKNLIAVGRLNSQAEVIQALQKADALLFPSRLEGMPLAVLEAMACGLPIICSNRASLPEVVKEGANGFVCEADHIAQYVKAIENLAAHKDKILPMGEHSTARVEREFDAERMVTNYIKIYLGITAQTQKGKRK